MKTLLVLLLTTCTALAAPTVNEIRLIDLSDGSYQPANGASITQGVQCVIRAKVNNETQSVAFSFVPGGPQVKPIVNATASADYMTPDAGQYVVTATPWSLPNATGKSGTEMRATYTVVGTATPTPAPTATPVPTATPTATPVPTPVPTPTPTATPVPTPVPTPTPTPVPTPTPTPTPVPTPSPVSLVTVTVLWNATKDHEYTIFYGKTQTANDAQVDGGKAFQAGPMCVVIANLEANTPYWFTNAVTVNGTQSPKGSPIAYTTKPISNQQVELP